MGILLNVSITAGTSNGPYTVYLDSIQSNVIPYFFNTTNYCSGLTLQQLYNGFDIDVPTTTTQVIIYNELCHTSQSFPLIPQSESYSPLCFSFNESDINHPVGFSFEPTNIYVDGKIQYSGYDVNSNYITIQWNSGTSWWNIAGYPTDGVEFRSAYLGAVPDTGWNAYGQSQNGTIYSGIRINNGYCRQLGKIATNSINVEVQNASCYNTNDGTLIANAFNGSGWTYSLNENVFSNYIGIFTGLGRGPYTVYAKDSEGNIVSQPVNIDSNPVTYFNLPYSIVTKDLESVGNTNYKTVEITYSTSSIPLGETISFNYKFIYNLIYKEPGEVTFDTLSHSVKLNNVDYSIYLDSSVDLIPTSPLPCNPTLYSEYNGSKTYSTNSLSLVNGDKFVVSITYGIDTQTNGGFIDSCLTQGSVNINAFFENISTTCQCCIFNGKEINEVGPVQIYKN